MAITGQGSGMTVPPLYPARVLTKDKPPEEELSFETNFTTVAAAGTPVRISSLYAGQTMTIWADDGNTGDVFVGNRRVNSTVGFPLAPNGVLTVNLTHGYEKHKYIVLYLDAANADDKIYWIKV